MHAIDLDEFHFHIDCLPDPAIESTAWAGTPVDERPKRRPVASTSREGASGHYRQLLLFPIH